MICIRNKDFSMNEDTVVTFGKFDGIHKGHRMLIDNAKKIAYENNLKLVVFTFKVVEGKTYPYMDQVFINSFSEREIFFERMNVDTLVEYPFDDEVADMEPLDFVKNVIFEKLHAKYVLVGEDWTFGKHGKGNADLLKAGQKLYDYEAVIFEKIHYEDREIGSTWIKEEISAGRMETVNILLGYPYTIIGEIVKGNQIGRTIDFPTVNIETEEGKLLPPLGVYASKIYVQGREYFGITNVGKKPTVTNQERITVETYIFDFQKDVYGETAEVQLVHFQRPEMKFENIEMLKLQIERDLSFTKEYFLMGN